MNATVVVVPFAVVLATVLVAAVTDVWKFKIHNFLTLPFLVSGLAYHAVLQGSSGLVLSLAGVVFGFAVLILFFLSGGIGGGDVKLVAGIGAWLGWEPTFYILLATCLCAGVYALVLIVRFGRFHETWINLKIIWYRLMSIGRQLGAHETMEEQIERPDAHQRLIPFAMMIATGLIGVLVICLFDIDFSGEGKGP